MLIYSQSAIWSPNPDRKGQCNGKTSAPGKVVSNHWTGLWTGVMDWITGLMFKISLCVSHDLQSIRYTNLVMCLRLLIGNLGYFVRGGRAQSCDSDNHCVFTTF